MKCLGFINSTTDDCLYTKRRGEKVEVLVLVYMDDMVIAMMEMQCNGLRGSLGMHFRSLI